MSGKRLSQSARQRGNTIAPSCGKLVHLMPSTETKDLCPLELPSPNSRPGNGAENVGDGTCNAECISIRSLIFFFLVMAATVLERI